MKIDGAVFKAARGLLGWTQGEIADAAGVSVSYVKYLETTSMLLDSRARPKALGVLSVFTSNDIAFVTLEDTVRGVVRLTDTGGLQNGRVTQSRDLSKIVPLLFVPET